MPKRNYATECIWKRNAALKCPDQQVDAAGCSMKDNKLHGNSKFWTVAGKFKS